jgi:hypothetical protein
LGLRSSEGKPFLRVGRSPIPEGSKLRDAPPRAQSDREGLRRELERSLTVPRTAREEDQHCFSLTSVELSEPIGILHHHKSAASADPVTRACNSRAQPELGDRRAARSPMRRLRSTPQPQGTRGAAGAARAAGSRGLAAPPVAASQGSRRAPGCAVGVARRGPGGPARTFRGDRRCRRRGREAHHRGRDGRRDRRWRRTLQRSGGALAPCTIVNSAFAVPVASRSPVPSRRRANPCITATTVRACRAGSGTASASSAARARSS